jgi:VWFA-related protein
VSTKHKNVARLAFGVTIAAGMFIDGRGVLAGQQQAPPPQASQPTFRSGVQLVEVDVRVFDRDGRFVADLAREDFELVEDGAPQKVAAMFLVGAGQPSAPATPNATTLPPSAPASPAPVPAAPQTWIFHFDLNHLTPGGGFDRARKAVEDFIRDRFKDGDLAGILAGDKMVNNRLTSVKQELLDAVKQVKPRSDSRTRFMELTREWPRLLDEEEAIRIARNEREPLQRAITRACSDDPDQCRLADMAVPSKGAKLAVEIQRDSLITLSTINGLVSGLARIPGPKTVVFLSDGFVAQEVELRLRSVVGQATRAGARFYAIDVRGLNRAGNPGIVDQFQVEDSAGPVTKFDGLADGPNSLAVDTGGLMIRNENNIGRALDRVADDSARYYVLAYQPANANFDGKYRPIQVRVKRDGVRVRARRGYLALPPSRMLIPQPIKPPAESAPEPAAVKEIEPPLPAPATGAVVVPTATAAPPAAAVPPLTAAPSVAVRLRPDTDGRIKALSAREATTGALATAGWEAYQRGDVEAALVAFSKAAAEPGVRPWVLYALGMSQAGLGQAANAIASWERVRKAVPDFEPVYMDLADTYAAMADLTSALAIVREAEKRWPSSADVHSAIGVIHVRRGALDEGIAALTKVTELAPDDGLAQLNLGRAYALRFQRGRRYVTSQRRWVAPEEDRRKAIEAFRQSVKIGGPYAQRANEELTLLEWSK